MGNKLKKSKKIVEYNEITIIHEITEVDDFINGSSKKVKESGYFCING